MRLAVICLPALLAAGCTHAPVAAPVAPDVPAQELAAEPAHVPPAANFDAAYQAAHRGKIRVSVPEVYELVHVALALTAAAQEDQSLTTKNTPYYKELMTYFAPVKDHPFVLALNDELEKNIFRYRDLKMNAYAFEYDRHGNIVRSKVFDRTSPPEDTDNDLLPYLEEMRDFSRKSRFRDFYLRHKPFYQSQIDFYTNELNIPEMHTWLRSHFSQVRPYDTINVLLSPLVRALQAVTSFESNGFRELQPHVNFPYPTKADAELTRRGSALRRGKVMFGEMNHGFIDPIAEQYADQIEAALADREKWVKPGPATETYDTPLLVFNEMMNWGLMSLYLVDKAPAGDREKLIEDVVSIMERRGFLQFRPFNAFLVNLYSTRPAGITIADLYPAIVNWLEQRKEKLPSADAVSKCPRPGPVAVVTSPARQRTKQPRNCSRLATGPTASRTAARAARPSPRRAARHP